VQTFPRQAQNAFGFSSPSANFDRVERLYEQVDRSCARIQVEDVISNFAVTVLMNSASAREIPSVAMWCADDNTFPVIVGKPKLEITPGS
jgi:hypothetical protein